MKMACGENPKRVYGGRGRMPSTRMGNFAVNRETWIEAQEYMAEEDPDRDLAMETLAGVLDGDILIQNHCYRADEMALVMDMAKEFGYQVAAFHHAVESYKIADLLRENDVCSAVWADWYGFKMEAYDAIPENAAMIHNAGRLRGDPLGRRKRHPAPQPGSRQGAGRWPPHGHRYRRCRRDQLDHPQRRTRHGHRRYDRQPRSGQDGRCGAVERRSAVSIYSRPEMVWIDGALMYDMNDPAMPPGERFRAGPAG